MQNPYIFCVMLNTPSGGAALHGCAIRHSVLTFDFLQCCQKQRILHRGAVPEEQPLSIAELYFHC